MSLITSENARPRIAAVLRNARRPMPAEEISRLSGVPHHQVLRLLERCAEFTRLRGMLWTFCGDTVAQEPIPWRDSRLYCGEKAAPHRPGADDFLQHGSVENGQWVPRKRPVLISSREA